jgi:hypothetical protein
MLCLRMRNHLLLMESLLIQTGKEQECYV